MHETKTIARINQKIAELEGQILKLRSLRENLTDPSIAALLEQGTPKLNTRASMGDGGHLVTRIRRSAHHEAVRNYLRSIKNRPTTSRELADATGLSRGALSNLLYHQRKEDFERLESSKDHQKQIRWRLRDATAASPTTSAEMEPDQG